VNVGNAMVAALLLALPVAAEAQAKPSFDCAPKLTSSVERRICQDPKLAALDRQLADVYDAAQATASAADKQTLTATQRAWVKGRNDCWKASDVPACVQTSYHNRISELQAQYRLVAPVGTGRYLCKGPPAQELVAEFFETDPPTAIVQFGGTTQFMRIARSGSGARYTGGNREFWEHQGVATLKWQASGKELSCPLRK
jgi:uncharacterized protein